MYTTPGSLVENRTMEKSYPERQFDVTKHNEYLVNPHDSHCCTFRKVKVQCGSTVPVP